MNEKLIMERFPTTTTESAKTRLALLQTLWAFERLEMHEWLVGPWMGTVYHDGLRTFGLEGLRDSVRDAAANMKWAAEKLEDSAIILDILLLDRASQKRADAS